MTRFVKIEFVEVVMFDSGHVPTDLECVLKALRTCGLADHLAQRAICAEVGGQKYNIVNGGIRKVTA